MVLVKLSLGLSFRAVKLCQTVSSLMRNLGLRFLQSKMARMLHHECDDAVESCRFSGGPFTLRAVRNHVHPLVTKLIFPCLLWLICIYIYIRTVIVALQSTREGINTVELSASACVLPVLKDCCSSPILKLGRSNSNSDGACLGCLTVELLRFFPNSLGLQPKPPITAQSSPKPWYENV